MSLETIVIEDANGDPQNVTVDTHDTDKNVQVVKIAVGADGDTPTLISTTDALPVSDNGTTISVDDGDGSLSIDDGGNVITVDGTVTIGSITAGDNNIGNVDVASVTPGTGATALGKAEDAAHTTGDVGVLALAVRDDNGGTQVDTDGDYTPLSVDSNGFLRVIAEFNTPVTGAAADGATAAGNPVQVAGKDGSGNIQALATDTDGNAQVDVLTLPALAAGDNNIGNVDVVTLPSIPAGSNNIGDVDILTVPADPFGANADAAVAAGAAGSIQAKLRRVTQGLEDLKSLIVLAAGDNNIGNVDIASALPAGTNAIGKLAANSGVDIGDVDVTSQPARARTTDTISAALATDAIMQGTTARTPAFVVISAASSGDNTVLAAQGSGNKIRVLGGVLVAAGTVDVRFESAAGGTALTGVIPLVANTGFIIPPCPWGNFETAGNALLNLELSAAIQVSGWISYVVVT